MIKAKLLQATLFLVFSLVVSKSWAAIVPTASKEITIPTIDISGEKERQTVVAWGTESVYQGHVHTLLMPDGKTIWAAWTKWHAGPCGPMKKSTDGGLTWNWVNNKPSNLETIFNCPTLHRLVDPSGKARLFIFAGNGAQHLAYSEDDGETWTPMKPDGLKGVVPPMSILPVQNGQKLLQWYCGDLNGTEAQPHKIWQAESTDGGLTWGNVRKVVDLDAANPNEPTVIRSPDGKQLLMLIRVDPGRLPPELRGDFNSLYTTSDDEGKTWSAPKGLPAALTAHRHNACYAPDGRLVVTMRDMAEKSPTKNNFVAWVGTYDDIINGREGQYRVKLLQNYPIGSMDCGYSGLHLLPDGTFVTTTYIKYTPGPEKNSIVSVRFNMSDLDALVAPKP